MKNKVIVDPLVVIVHWYSGVLELLERKDLSLRSIKTLIKESDEIVKFLEESSPNLK